MIIKIKGAIHCDPTKKIKERAYAIRPYRKIKYKNKSNQFRWKERKNEKKNFGNRKIR